MSIREVVAAPKALDMVDRLVLAQEATTRTAQGLCGIVGAAADQPTADLLTRRVDVHDWGFPKAAGRQSPITVQRGYADSHRPL